MKPLSNTDDVSSRRFRLEVDRVSRDEWSTHLAKFKDANFAQTWDYESILYPRRKIARLLLWDGDEVAGMTQASFRMTPVLPRGVA